MQCCYMTTWRAPSVCLKNLLDHEKNYSVIDKEALDITLVLQGSIHQYVYGHKFTSCTDHKPLEHILGLTRRFQKWLQIDFKGGV